MARSWTLHPNSAASTGVGTAWADPGNAKGEDGTTTLALLTPSGATSAVLQLWDFRAATTIPEDHGEIKSVTVRVKGSGGGDGGTPPSEFSPPEHSHDDLLQLLQNSGGSRVAAGDNRATGLVWNQTMAWHEYEGKSEDWNISLGDILFQENFGVQIAFHHDHLEYPHALCYGSSVLIDAVEIVVAESDGQPMWKRGHEVPGMRAWG